MKMLRHDYTKIYNDVVTCFTYTCSYMSPVLWQKFWFDSKGQQLATPCKRVWSWVDDVWGLRLSRESVHKQILAQWKDSFLEGLTFRVVMLLFELCEWCVWTGPPWNFSSLLITQTYGPAKVHECISLFLHFTAQSRSFHCTFLSRDISVPPCPMLPGPAAGNGTSQSC